MAVRLGETFMYVMAEQETGAVLKRRNQSHTNQCPNLLINNNIQIVKIGPVGARV